MALPETGFVIAPQIPRGLAPAVEGLAREILRHRPQDIYTFAAHHFEQLVKLREKERIAGIISKTSDRLSRNGQDCIRWTDRVDPDDSRHRGDRKIINLVEEIAKEPRRTAAITTKLSRRRKEATNRSGWSINETVKVIKRHDCENDAKKKKRGNTRMPEKAIKKEVRSLPEQCSPPSSKRITRCRFLRSSSAGDILAKTITLQHRPPGTDTSEKECIGNSGDKNTLKRQKSADQIKRTCSSEVPTEKRHTADPRRSQSLVNVRSKRNGFDAEESWRRVMGNGENQTISRNRLEKKLEERFGSASVRNAEAVLAKLNLRSEKDERESKDNDRVFDDGNAAAEASSILPSVVRRQSSCRYSRSSSRNDACESVEQNDPNNLILPPISSDASKPIEIENDLTLPSLAKATDVQQNSDILGNPEATSSDHDSADASVKNECENEHDKGVGATSLEEDEPDTSDRDILKELEVSRSPDPRGGEVDEVFKDSLNVTPDSMEFPQRPDSLEHPEEKSSTVVDAEQENETREPELDHPRSNELKKKLLEIETVERSIENALVSSERGVTRHDDSTSTSSVVKLSPNSGSEVSSFVLENETILPDSSNEKHTEVEEEPTKKDSPKEQSRREDEGVETDSASLESSRKKSDASESLSVDSPKDIDPSCFILTEGSPCEIPESVTTVIIPDRPPENDDEVLEHVQETDGVPRLKRAVSRRVNRETRHEEEEAFRHCADPFGEYISPEYNVDYSHDIQTAAGQANPHHDLGNIKEEEENEKDASDKEITRSTVLPEDVTFEESHPSEGIAETNGSKNEVESAEPVSSSLDQSSGDVESTSPGVTTDVQSGPCEGNQREQGEAPGPYVPELNLDSLRDATISSTEDSRNLENQSEKETDDVTLQEGEKTLSLSDTSSSGKKATLDEDSSRRKSLPDKESGQESSDQEAEVGNEVENCSIELVDKSDDVGEKDEKDSSNVEDEIAKELIQILTLDSPPSQEEETEKAVNASLNNTGRADDTNLLIEGDPRIHEVGSTAATESVVSTNRSSASSPRERKEDVQEENGEEARIDTNLVAELDPCVRETAPMAATEAVDISTNRSSTSSPQEKISQGQNKEVEGVDANLAMEINPSAHEEDVKEENEGERVEAEGKANVEDNAPSMSAETIDEVTTDMNDSSLENPDPSDKIEPKGGDLHDAEEPIAPDMQTLDAAARRIQYWARKFVVGQGRLTKIAKRSPRDSSSPATSESIKKENQASSESPRDGQNSEECEISDKSKETEDEEQSINEKETQIDTSMSASLRHTGEFHDSLPLPLFEVSKSSLPAKDVRALRNMPANPWFAIEPDASCFSSQSPRANVFLAFDFSNPFQSVENKADGSKYYLNFPPCFVHVERTFDETNANDDTSVASLTEKMVDSSIDDVLEPLAIDEPPKSLLIEEIPNDEEEQQPAPTDSCKRMAGTSASSSSEEQQPNRDDLSADQTTSADNGPNLRESLSSDSSVIQSDENIRDKTDPGKIESPNMQD